jgi:hypothetical protein
VLSAAEAALLHRAARRALEARTRGERGYLRRFEREVGALWAASPRRMTAAGRFAEPAPLPLLWRGSGRRRRA